MPLSAPGEGGVSVGKGSVHKSCSMIRNLRALVTPLIVTIDRKLQVFTTVRGDSVVYCSKSMCYFVSPCQPPWHMIRHAILVLDAQIFPFHSLEATFGVFMIKTLISIFCSLFILVQTFRFSVLP